MKVRMRNSGTYQEPPFEPRRAARMLAELAGPALNQPETFLDTEMHVHRLHGGTGSTFAEIIETADDQHALLGTENEQIDAIGVVVCLDIEEPAVGIGVEVDRGDADESFAGVVVGEDLLHVG